MSTCAAKVVMFRGHEAGMIRLQNGPLGLGRVGRNQKVAKEYPQTMRLQPPFAMGCDGVGLAASAYLVAFSRNLTSARRSCAEVIFCSGILVPGVHMMSSFFTAGEKL